MRNSPRSSAESAPCRLEWRPSRWPVLALLILAPLAAASAWLSGVPRPLDWVLAIAALGWGAWQARAYAHRRRRTLVLDAAGNAALDGEQAQAWRVMWRGPLAVVQLVDANGARCQLAWWPDTLPPHLGRELRLAGWQGGTSRHVRPMAP